MKLIKEEKIETLINDQYVWDFGVIENGAYLVSISASCKNWRQNFKRLFKDDDLGIQIDNYLFPEIKGKKREFESSGSWNGNEIKNNIKDVLFLLPLKAGNHKIKFWVDGHPILKEIQIYKIEESETELTGILTQSKFLDIISKNLKIEKLEIKAKAEVYSNLEIKIDGTTQKNLKYKKFAKWYWYGRELRGSSKDYNMPDIWDEELHSLQLKMEGNPEIESIKLKIDLENIVYSRGVVRLYKDIVIRDDVNLRSDYTDESESLLMLQDSEKIEILNERVKGKYIENLSEIWHEVAVRGVRGYILSSYIEIEGQEREKIVDLIKEKCNQYGVDANIMLAIAGRESHFKPFAQSYKGPLGIFQLSEDTRNDFGVVDPYNFYQNVEGGIKNYKDIERRISGHGDILIKRLAAWHDGPTTTIAKINNKTFDYNKLSNKTKTFIKNVQANIEKKDWYHIIYLPIILLFFTSSLFISSRSEKIIAQYGVASAINHDSLMYYQSKTHISTITSNFSSIFNHQKYESKNYYSYFPNVFINKTNNKIIFLNSKKNITGEIDVKELHIDEFLGILDGLIPGRPNNTYVGSVILENPENVFYFGATDSNACGASNCSWVFYRFNANKNELKMINSEVFGEITGIYLSSDFRYIAVTSNSASGVCSNYESLDVFNTTTFVKLNINGFDDNKYGSQTLENILWKNNNEIEFVVTYSRCPMDNYEKVTWLYNIDEQKITRLKTKMIIFNP